MNTYTFAWTDGHNSGVVEVDARNVEDGEQVAYLYAYRHIGKRATVSLIG